jgi:hypothetical protein
MDWFVTLPGPHGATEFLFVPSPSALGALLTTSQGAEFPVDPSIDLNMFIGMNTQMSQVPTLYSGDLDVLGAAGPSVAPGLGLPVHIPDVLINPFVSNGNVGGSMNIPGTMMDVNPRGAWANLPFHQGNAGAQERWTNTGDVPVHNGSNITTSSLRLRGTRLPPRTHEGDVCNLYNRLIREGADLSVAAVLHDIIFAGGVTFEALMAPIRTREMSDAYGGATRMWQLLLKAKEVVPGEQKYHCLLCPVGNRKAYKYDRDAVRHFNKDHFGFSFPCNRW